MILSVSFDRELLALQEILGYAEGQLPLKYLGVSLIEKELHFNDCLVLSE